MMPTCTEDFPVNRMHRGDTVCSGPPARRTVLAAVAACLAGVGLGAVGSDARAAARRNMQVWKSPSCGCCADWITHVEASGVFQVVTHDIGNNAARARLGMPTRLGSCHTALVDGYVVEGHVPVSDVLRLLRERPEAVGLAVPGMPIGSPGMDAPVYGGRRDPYEVLLVLPDGSTRVFASHR